jgi:hypothetical protein
VEQHRRRLTCSRCLQFKSSASSMTFASRRSPIRHTTQKHTVSDRPQRCPRLHSVSSVVPNSKARCWTLRQQLCRFALADWERGAVPCPRVRVRDQCQSARLVFTSPPPKPSARSRGRSCPTLLCVPIHRQLGKSFSQSEPCHFACRYNRVTFCFRRSGLVVEPATGDVLVTSELHLVFTPPDSSNTGQ